MSSSHSLKPLITQISKIKVSIYGLTIQIHKIGNSIISSSRNPNYNYKNLQRLKISNSHTKRRQWELNTSELSYLSSSLWERYKFHDFFIQFFSEIAQWETENNKKKFLLKIKEHITTSFNVNDQENKYTVKPLYINNIRTKVFY